jgi:hypothetical protein
VTGQHDPDVEALGATGLRALAMLAALRSCNMLHAWHDQVRTLAY